MSISQKQAQLNQELRDYAESIDQVFYTIPIEQLRSVLRQDFPDLANLELTTTPLLEELGIAHVFQTSKAKGRKLILCSIVGSLEEAVNLNNVLQRNQFATLRSKLNVLSHWIFATPLDYMYLNSRDEFVDWCCDFAAFDEPEVFIIDEISMFLKLQDQQLINV